MQRLVRFRLSPAKMTPLNSVSSRTGIAQKTSEAAFQQRHLKRRAFGQFGSSAHRRGKRKQETHRVVAKDAYVASYSQSISAKGTRHKERNLQCGPMQSIPYHCRDDHEGSNPYKDINGCPQFEPESYQIKRLTMPIAATRKIAASIWIQPGLQAERLEAFQ